LGLGPAATVSGLVPDLHHFRGSFGGKDVIPLYRDPAATQPNVPNNLLATLGRALGQNITAEDFFCYTYAILAAPTYVETFSEELTIPGPRLPLTRNRTLFGQAADVGRRLIWLHTHGERFVPEGHRRGEVPQGTARCERGVPTTADGYPENYSFESTPQTLRVGGGIFRPVSNAMWKFSVSGLSVLQSWLDYRMRAGAGRSSSLLDEIRPEIWTAMMTQELLELLWVLEATVASLPKLSAVFANVIASETFGASELPVPGAAERSAPGAEVEPRQHEIEL
jgi:hypothetical protein